MLLAQFAAMLGTARTTPQQRDPLHTRGAAPLRAGRAGHCAMMSVSVPVAPGTPSVVAHAIGLLLTRMMKCQKRAPLNGPLVMRPLSTFTDWPSSRVAVQLSSLQVDI